MAKLISVGVMTVATNKYVHYWKELALSINSLSKTNCVVTLHVFTDQVDVVREFSKKLDLKVVIHRIPGYGWPQATLYRYKIFYEHQESLREDILMHVDADMLMMGSFRFENLLNELEFGVCLVQHPGYYRPPASKSLKYYLNRPKSLVSDLKSLIATGGLGAWEQNRKSLAYVPRKIRKSYFCGGVWWGNNREILLLCKTLSKNVEDDEKNNVIAKWHDESHLNWWATQNNFLIESPSYCYAQDYPQIQDLKPLIQALDKSVWDPILGFGKAL
jgi:hypothetical protein